MPSFPYALPGALRLRSLQPLIDGDGACSLVYDVERAAVFEVPEELRLHVAAALDTGNLDEEILGWLASADLLTAESSWDWPAAAAMEGGCWDLVQGGFGSEEAHGWIDQPDAAAVIADLELAWKRGLGCSRIQLHLDWVGNFPADGLFERVVAHARRRAALSRQEVSFELALDPEQVTAEIARRLSAQQVHVRLRCGEVDPLVRVASGCENRPWLLAEPAVRLLLAQPPLLPLLTVQCILDGPVRLIELWRWAGALGVRSLDAIRLTDSGAGDRPGCGSPSACIREYRKDLYTIYEETCDELEAGRAPIDFQPLTRIVRRLIRNRAAAVLGPFAGMESYDPRLVPELMWTRLEQPAEPETPGLPCQSCWARQVCSHSAWVASALGKEDPREPSREHCGFWAAEAEMAVRLFHRLDQIDAFEVLRFFEDAPGLAAPRTPILAEAPASKPS